MKVMVLKKFLEEGNVPQDGITQIAEEATSVCYLLQDNNNDHITIFYPGAMDGRYAQKRKTACLKRQSWE